jgi:8-oxo-dGTP diphosphatase
MSRDEKRFLNNYDPEHYERPSIAVDLVVFTVMNSVLKVLLLQRKSHPFKGVWALPGGFVHISNTGNQGEGVEEAAHRELAEETGIPPHSCFIEQLHTFGKAGRDPRMRVISVAWYALLSPHQAHGIDTEKEGSAQWFSADEDVPWMRLSFDHAEILDTAVERVREKTDTSNIAFELVDDAFTVAELHDAHEAIKARRYDSRNFRRRFQRMVEDGVVVEAPGKRHRGRARPAKVWRHNH